MERYRIAINIITSAVALCFVIVFMLSSGVAIAQVGGCFVSGAGNIGSDLNDNGISDQPGTGNAQQDSYGGAVMGMKDGRVRGVWQDTTHLADENHVFQGQAEFLYCWNDGGPGPDVPLASHSPSFLFSKSVSYFC